MSPQTPPIKVDIWSDVACPWCYLGMRRFERALETFREDPAAPSVEVEYHSYQLNPDLPPDFEGRHSDYLANRLGMAPEQIAASNRNLSEMGAAVGAEYRMERVAISNTLKAHELLHFAKAKGRQPEMKGRLLRAFWGEGRRLGRIDELAELAAEVGLDRDEALRVLKTGEFREAVRADRDQAARLGIRGVPFFVLDGTYGLSGAQEPATLLRPSRLLPTKGEGRRDGSAPDR